MRTVIVNPIRFIVASASAGVWVVVSGMLMAGAFGYRDMKLAFDAIGLPVPRGLAPLVTHTLVRLVLGASVVVLMGIMARVFSRTGALLTAVGFVWLLSMVLPYAVIADWGIFPWSVAIKFWTWSAGELLIAGLIGRLIYPMPATARRT